MKKRKQLIIIGGGASIKEGILKNLWKQIEDKFVIGINYSYKYFSNPTVQCFVDNDFYNSNCKEMENLGLIIGNKKAFKKQLPNTIVLPSMSTYYKDIKHGVYKASLAGLFSLTLAIYLLEEGDVFLLGFDYGETRKSDFTKFTKNSIELNKIMLRDKQNRALTHFYQGEINHRGIGKINYYNANNRAEKDFGVYLKQKNVNIYNVSKISKITSFPTLTYDEFFKKLNKETFDQDSLRESIKKKLHWIKKG